MHVGLALLTLPLGPDPGPERAVRGLLEEFGRGNGPEQLTVLANRRVAEGVRAYEQGPVRVRRVSRFRGAPRDIDVLHHPVAMPLPKLGVPTVTTLNHAHRLDRPGRLPAPRRALRRASYERAARGADLVITDSEHSRARLLERSGLAPDRVEVVPPGVDLTRFTPEPREEDLKVRERLRLPDRYFAYPADLTPKANHNRLVEALAECHDPELGLVLSGEDDGALDELVAYARSAGVGERVRHAGVLDQEELGVLLRGALAMVFPSRDASPAAPTLEAMACGCPVACPDRGALPEVAGDAALGFNPNSVLSIAAGLRRMAADEVLRRRLRAAGLERAERFSWEAAAARHRDIYERAAELAAAR